MLSFVAEYHHIYPGLKVNHPKRALSKLLKKGCPPGKLTRRYSKKVYTGLTMPGFKLHYYRIVNLHTWMSLSLASNLNLWDRWSIYLSIYLSYSCILLSIIIYVIYGIYVIYLIHLIHLISLISLISLFIFLF